jgi:tetratricopeptide (TPR) repeat protein
MSDSGPSPAVPAPQAAPPGPDAPIQVGARRSPFLRRVASVLHVLARRPGRTLAVVALTVVIAAGAAMAGLQAWGYAELRAARLAVAHYHNRQAHELLEAYLSVWPRDPDALLLAARTARRTAAFERAEVLLDGYESVRGRDDEDLILERVLLRAQRGRVDGVADYCQARVRDHHPSAPLVLEAQVAGLMRDYRLVEAQERLQTWLKLRPDECQALLLQGTVYDMQGRSDEAIAAYQRVVELDPDNEDARLRLTGLLMQSSRPADAFPHLEYLRKARPDDPLILTRIARCRVEMGQADEARRLLDGVLARDPHFPEALEERGKVAMEEGDHARAERLLREAVARDPGAVEARYHLYRCLSAQGKEAEAQEAQQAADALDKDLREMQDIVGGRMQRTPYDPALHTRAGEIALRTGAAEDGVRWLESALELDPHYAPAHKALARYYEAVGDRVRAAQHWAQAEPAAADGPAKDAPGRP